MADIEPTKVEPTQADPDARDGATDGDFELCIQEGPASTRYQVGEEIARGGVGKVLSAHDRILGREIAIKLLQTRFRDDPRAKRRFLNEAKIIAKLQHPGIVPIYEVIKGPSDSWLISMPLVRGTTLRRLLSARQTPDWELPRFLKVFEKVCQTMAYAHEKGVIHRDLKPDNVMIGPFGEVFVMDWGIAKVLGEGAAAEESPADAGSPTSKDTGASGPGRQSCGSDPGTQIGSILGTPGFMAPEQARGDLARVGKHSDVFSLGAILCLILSGKGPYGAKDSTATRFLAEREDTKEAFSRLDARGFDQELIALVKSCLGARPEDRPKDAGEVARRITHYLESKTEEFSRGWLNLTTDGIWDWNLETGEEYFSPSFKKLLGFEEADFPNRAERWQKFIHPDDLRVGLQAFKEHTEEGKPFNVPLRYRHKDGSTVWVLCRGVALRNDAGKFTRFVGTCSDITALIRAEDALAEGAKLAELGADIGVALNRPGTLPDMLQRCVEVFVRRLEVAFARIWTLSRTGDVLELQASAGLYTHLDGPHSRVPVGRFKIGLIAQERKPHLTNSVVGDSRVGDQEWARREGMVAFAGHPLIYRERVVGVLAMFSRQPFSAMTFEGLSTVADSIAYAIAHLEAVESVRVNEERFNLAIRGTDEGIWDWNVLTNEVYHSSRLKELLGLQEHELQNHFSEFETRLHPEDRDRVLEMVRQHLERRSTYKVDLRLRTKSGEYRWFHSRGQALWDADGRAVRMVGSISDIHERKKAEELFRGLLESSPDALAIVNHAGTIIIANRQLQQLFAYRREELLGQPIEILIPPHLRTRHIPMRDGYLAAPHVRPMGAVSNLVGCRKDGREFPAEISLSPLQTVEGLFVSVVIRDISERKAMEDALRESGEWNRSIVNNVADAIIGKDLDGIVRSWNKAAQTIFGYSAEEMVGQPIARLVPADRLHEETEILERLRCGEQVDPLETVRICKDGRRIEVLVTHSPICASEGRIVGVSKIVHDVSDPKQMRFGVGGGL